MQPYVFSSKILPCVLSYDLRHRVCFSPRAPVPSYPTTGAIFAHCSPGWNWGNKRNREKHRHKYLGDSGRLHPRKNHKQNAAKFKCKIKLSIPVWRHCSEVFLTKTPNSRCEISWNHTCSRCGDAIIQCKSRTTCLTTTENIIPNKSCKKECMLSKWNHSNCK